MRSRIPVLLGLLFCGGLAVAALWQALSRPAGDPFRLIAWGALVVFGGAFVWLLVAGLIQNTREKELRTLAAARAPAEAAREVAASFFPHAPDTPGLGLAAAELLRVPSANRDAAWETNFYAAITAAELVPADPPEFTGPDGLRYAGFRLAAVTAAAGSAPAPAASAPAAGSASTSAASATAAAAASAPRSLARVAETLTERGLGAVLNPQPDHVSDWVFSCGDLLSLRLFGRIAAGPPPTQLEQITAGSEILAASPSESLLPAPTRALLRRFMQDQLGIAEPAVFLLVDAGAHPPESLVFNLFPDRLAPGWTLDGAFRYLSWYLPRHYRLIGIPENSSLTEHFRAI